MLTAAALASLFISCAPDVSPKTLNAFVSVESAAKPYVVANVSDNTSHYFDTQDKAVRFINNLERDNKTYSAGLMQVYSKNFKAYGLNTENVFDYCTNIKAGAEILKKCYATATNKTDDPQDAIRKAASCYYSGNFTRGFKKEADGKSYVERIELAASKNFAVPEIKTTDSGMQSSKPDDDKSAVYTDQAKSKNSWDVFGDY